MTYIVWIDNRSEGWSPSEELQILNDCMTYVHANAYGHNYVITRPVTVKVVEDDEGGA